MTMTATRDRREPGCIRDRNPHAKRKKAEEGAAWYFRFVINQKRERLGFQLLTSGDDTCIMTCTCGPACAYVCGYRI